MEIDATSMIGTARPAGAVRETRTAEPGEFARVFDLADVRRRRMTGPDRIPDHVWDDITRASELADDLATRGQRVRFKTHHLTGRVVATLCDQDGRSLRPLSLQEVLGAGPGPDPDPATAA
ncbi:MAG TPA: hypothetical protein VFT50_08645 [Baekduia sp.]|nr:hypothetical protein [Baekduia sp.]